MKTKILNALKTEYATMGLGDKAFDGVAAFLEKTITDENDIITKVKGDDVKALLKGFQGATDVLRGEKSQLAKDFEDYKKAHPSDTPAPKPTDDSETLKLLKEMQSKYDALEGKFNENQSKAKKDSIIAALGAKLKDTYPAAITNLALKSLEVADSDTADGLLEKVQASCNTLYSEFYGDGAIPPSGRRYAGPAPTDDPNEFKAGVDKLKSRGLYPTK